ncbi:MAG: hypothetical protein JSV99_00670 [Planctomycetota bacterium]|nr:MAG: hypothetical protein JSV99_00670 [Planctomycetota bacterium]
MPAKFVAQRPYIRPCIIIETAIVRESYEKLKRERLEDVQDGFARSWKSGVYDFA